MLAEANASSMRAVGDAVLGEHHRERAEGVGLDGVDPDVEERTVQRFDDVGPRDVQDLVAAFERGAAEVVRLEVPELEIGARRAVVDENALRQSTQVRVVGARSSERRTRDRLHWFTRLLGPPLFTTLTT